MWPWNDDGDAEHPASDAPPTARQARALARDIQRINPEAAAPPQDAHLQPPPQRLTPAARLRNIRENRSPSPSPNAASSHSTFNFPSLPSTMDPEQLRIIVESACKAAVDAARQSSTVDSTAIVEAAINAAHAGQQKSRKPNIPAFDPKNIDTWLRRMNAAFDRLEITDPKLKFAHIDEKIPSDTDPIINDLLCGVQNQEKWDELIDYLREKHGKTIEERAWSVIEGTDRDGRTPSQLWAVMMDRAGKVTLDDVLKQQLLKRLPQEVRQHLANKVEGKTGKEVAALADVYFDKQGKLKNFTPASGINSVRPPQPSSLKPTETPPNRPPETPASHTPAYEPAEDATDINLVRFKQGQKQRFNNENRGQPRGRSKSRGRGDNSSNGNGNSGGPHRYSNNGGRSSGNNSGGGNGSGKSNNSGKTPKVCFYHVTYGKEAEKCEETCMLWSQHQPAKGRASR